LVVTGATDGRDMGCQRQLTVNDDTEVASAVRDGDTSVEHQDVVFDTISNRYLNSADYEGRVNLWGGTDNFVNLRQGRVRVVTALKPVRAQQVRRPERKQNWTVPHYGSCGSRLRLIITGDTIPIILISAIYRR